MSTPTKRTAKKAAPAKRAASSVRVRGRDTDSTRDAIERAAELASEQRDEGQTGADGVRIMDVDTAANFAAGLPDKYLDCRLGRHQDRYTDIDDHGRNKGWTWRRYCPRCKFERTEHFDRDGMLINISNVHYPEGYLAVNMGRVDSYGRGRMRVEKVKRVLQQKGIKKK